MTCFSIIPDFGEILWLTEIYLFINKGYELSSKYIDQLLVNNPYVTEKKFVKESSQTFIYYNNFPIEFPTKDEN